MSKEDIEKMQTGLNILVDKMNKIIDDDIYGSKRTYYQYKIEILKRDIMIAKLQYMLTFEKSLEPLPPIFIKQPLTELRDEIMRSYQVILSPAKVEWKELDYSIRIICAGETLVYYHKGSETLEIKSINRHLAKIVATYFMRLKEKNND